MAPLSGVRIISLAGQYPGPYATLLLSDLGAEVIFIERPDGGDPVRSFPGFFATLNRDKASVVIDLKSSKGQEELLALVTTSDVLIDGFRPNVLNRLGVGRDRLREVNPQLIIISATGYGRTGPYSARSGHDLTYRAEAGMVTLDGSVNQSSFPIADVLGAHAILESVLIGLFTRQLKEPSLDFDVSIFDALISTLSIYLEPLWNEDGTGGFPAEPGYSTFTTADKQIIALGVAHEDKFWQALCAVLGLIEEQQLTSNERFAHRDKLRRRIANAIACFEAPLLEAQLLAHDVPFGWARSLDEIAIHSQVIARELTGNIQNSQRTYVRQPLIIDGERPTKGHRTAPVLGEDTTTILTEHRFAEDYTENEQIIGGSERFNDLPGEQGFALDMQSQKGGAND